ncbi:hypothetical protein ACHAW6_015666 [Cyclotella cf. meneghiniana]
MNRTDRPSTPPPLHSIHRGIVTRLVPYGCFVKLSPPSSHHSGLVHISQLHPTKIEHVRDVVDVDMQVYVKIMRVETLQQHDERSADPRTKTKHRIRLSMKYVNQENGHDDDPDNTRTEIDSSRSGRKGGGANDIDRGVDSVLGRALSSNIGMSCALDPGNLILRGSTAAAGGDDDGARVTYNGYCLVGEEEGEEEEDVAYDREENRVHDRNKEDSRETTNMIRPMGRGRGTTLPAWMTRGNDHDALGKLDRAGMVHDKQNDSDEDSHPKEKGRKHGKKDDRHDQRSKRHKKHDRRKDRRRRKHEHRSSPSTSSCSSSREKKRSHRDRNDRSHKRRKVRHTEYSESPARKGDFKPDAQFANVEEARAVMERLERQRRER